MSCPVYSPKQTCEIAANRGVYEHEALDCSRRALTVSHGGPRWVEQRITSRVNCFGLSPKEFPRWPIPPGRPEWVLDTQFLLQALANERAIMARSWAWTVEPE